VRQPEPENVHRWRSLNHFEPGEGPNFRESSIGANGQQRTHFMQSINALVTDTSNRALLLNQRLDIRSRPKPELCIFARFTRDEFEKLGLRNQHDVRELSLQPMEVKWAKARIGGSQGWAEYLDVPELVQWLC